jgi:hypothetical protein
MHDECMQAASSTHEGDIVQESHIVQQSSKMQLL